MKYLMIILTAGIFFTACKSKDTDSKKDLILLQTDNNSYLSDTGIAVTTDVRSGLVEDATPKAAPVRNAVPVKRATVRNSSVSNSGSGSSSTTSSSTTRTTQKKGVSKAAKGAIIGGVGGAAAGAVIGKNAKGAVIGGVVGAAGGYIIGRNKDKKDGRVQ